MSPAEVCRKAAQVIRERGLYKGWYHDGGTIGAKVCMVGAIRVACHGKADAVPQSLVYALLTSQPGVLAVPDGWKASDWNDEPERTAEEVAAALEATAARMEAAQ